ncbi:VOC family protein [Pseudoclavibacter chungangensis]|uniref:VOC family protein n=1 Tax=Pseudoclavibacter chungangensis TaxID=587635 RepID=A0A7J5BN64_9MICO|nr:VOC family protein [Pseudoclavibacter chungangensis]KAB1653417.1 VOC family protein [Pseudoclavibacter chungangensis]KAB1657219.1 VOC family protein [Pseudoclavibacter chungangensis]NYJ66350.1 PhnB protein [Pseudoclavibacter chungangensis]
MAQLLPYLNFPGTTREAMTFYASVFGGEVGFSTYGEFNAAPEGHPAYDAIMHSQLTGGGATLMAADAVENFGPPVVYGNNISLSFVGPEEELFRGYFDALADGGTVIMPLDKQVWGDIYGAVVDRFGINWMFNIEVASAESA